VSDGLPACTPLTLLSFTPPPPHNGSRLPSWSLLVEKAVGEFTLASLF